MIEHVLLFGAAGDLAARLLAPALARLQAAGALPAGFRLVGLSRDDWDDDRFRAHIDDALRDHADGMPAEARATLLDTLAYRRADATDPADIAAALEGTSGPVVVYLALPPGLFPATVSALAEAGLPAGSRLAIEKPFGEDLASARELNRLLHEHLSEQAVFRVDHFLGLQATRNLLALRFANHVFAPLWSADHIERVDVIWDETLALEGRAGYYDDAGALRDVVQNHLLQILGVAAMEPPASLVERDFRDQKAAVLRAVHAPSREEVRRSTVRGRYTAGTIDGQRIPAYVDEDGVDPSGGTETFADLTLRIDNQRWDGVPFRLRTGKALHRNRHELVITFRGVRHPAFAGDDAPPDRLVLDLDSGQVRLGLNLDEPGEAWCLSPTELTNDPGDHGDPYARILLAVLEGDLRLSVRDDEAEDAWRIVEPVLAAWGDGEVPMADYPAGSDGPAGTPGPGAEGVAGERTNGHVWPSPKAG